MTTHNSLCTANAPGPEPTYALPYPGYSGNHLTSLFPSQTLVFCRVLQFLDNSFFVVVYWVIFAHCVSGGDVRMLMCSIFNMTGGLHLLVSYTSPRKGKEKEKQETVCLCIYSMTSVIYVESSILYSCLYWLSVQTAMLFLTYNLNI